MKFLIVLSLLFSTQVFAMNKAELIDAVASDAGISKAKAKKAVDSFFDVFTKAHKKGQKVALSGFGTLTSKKYRSGKTQTHKVLKIFRKKYIDKATPLLAQVIGGGEVTNLLNKGLNRVFMGGDDYVVRKRPGRIKYSNVTLKRGSALAEELGNKFRLTHTKQVLLNNLIKSTINSFLKMMDQVAVLRNDVDIAGAVVTAQIMKTQISIGIEEDGLNKVYFAIVGTMNQALAAGERVMIPGFGTFFVEPQVRRTGRNPQTGKEIKIAGKSVVKFKAGADLSGRVN